MPISSPAGRLAAAPLLVALAGLAACAAPKPQIASPAPPPRPAPVVEAPVALSAIHHGLTPPEQAWHVRSALNVAALQCSNREGQGIIRNYNAMLSRHKAPLAEAYAAKQARFQQVQGKAWQRAFDQHMTRLYNHWAWPPAQARFCDSAAEVVLKAASLQPAEFMAFATRALPLLDRPIAQTAGQHMQLSRR